jgi:hypothetical protein
MGDLSDFSERLRKRMGFVHGLWEKSKVEVFRKAVSLKVALLQACSALKDPMLGRLWVLRDSRENPAKHVILFDDVWSQLPLVGTIENVLLPDHV